MRAEDSLLRVLLLDNAAYWRIAELVTPDDFSPKGRRILEAIRDGLAAGAVVDEITISATDQALGREASDITANAVGVAANLATYAAVLAKAGEQKRLRGAGQRIAQAETFEEAQSLLASVRPRLQARLKSAKDGLGEMVDALQRRFSADGALSGTPTGLLSLDELTSGWQPGNLVILAARPGMGKTAMALQAAMASGGALFVSLEMTAGELMERAVANAGRLPHRWMRFPKDAPDEAMTRITEASRIVSALPLQIDDSATLTGEAICARVRQAHMANPLKLVIVDHLGLVSREGKHDPSELGAITSQLKRLAKETETTVLLLCQLNRGLESRNDKRPVLADLRDSGRIEEDADVVIVLYRDEYYDEASQLKGYMELILRKNRSGELGTAWSKSLLSCMTLETTDEPERSAGAVSDIGRRGGFSARFGARPQQARLPPTGTSD